MAHNSQKLPWSELACNLKHVSHHSRFELVQAKTLNRFAARFTNIIKQCSANKRLNFASSYRIVDPSDEVISDSMARKISKVVSPARSAKFHNRSVTNEDDPGELLCSHEEPGDTCDCTFKYEERLFGSILCLAAGNVQPDPRHAIDPTLHRNTEVLQALILHGDKEMVLLLRAAENENSKVHESWRFFKDANSYLSIEGWSGIMSLALMSYICLNVFHYQQRASDRTQSAHTDYRSTYAYRTMLVQCTGSRDFDIITHPHREFFRVPPGQYKNLDDSNPWESRDGFQDLSNHDFANLDRPSDLDQCINILWAKGLPMELCLEVVQNLDAMERVLLAINDPLHLCNALELKKYLERCWELLVKCDMLVNRCGKSIDWEYEVSTIIKKLWNISDSNVMKGGISSSLEGKPWIDGYHAHRTKFVAPSSFAAETRESGRRRRTF